VSFRFKLDVGSYADFKSMVAMSVANALNGPGTVFYGTGGGSYRLQWIANDYKALINWLDAGSPPGSLLTDFPAAVSLTGPYLFEIGGG